MFSNTLYSQYYHVAYSDLINVFIFLEKILKERVVYMRLPSQGERSMSRAKIVTKLCAWIKKKIFMLGTSKFAHT